VSQNISAKEASDIVHNLTTKNQKAFYEGLKDEAVEKIEPRGSRAIEYFSEFLEYAGSLPESLDIDESIDFYVNDHASAGYNIFKIIF